jgi:hypothetical protein
LAAKQRCSALAGAKQGHILGAGAGRTGDEDEGKTAKG